MPSTATLRLMKQLLRTLEVSYLNIDVFFERQDAYGHILKIEIHSTPTL